MPLDWANMNSRERAQAILDDIEGLDDSDVQEILAEWQGLDETENVLTRMALDRVASKHGGMTSKQRARASLRRRGVIE